MTLSFGGGAGVLTIPGVTSDGASPGGVVVAGDEQVGGVLNVGDLTNAPDPNYPLVIGPGGSTFYVRANGDGHFLGALSATAYTARGGSSSMVADSTISVALSVIGKGSVTTDANILDVVNNVGKAAHVDGAANIRTDAGLGIFGHAAPATQVVLATGASHTVDDIITLLQSYGLCKQS